MILHNSSVPDSGQEALLHPAFELQDCYLRGRLYTVSITAGSELYRSYHCDLYFDLSHSQPWKDYARARM